MPIIRLEMFEGRSIEQKREFAAAVTREACRTLKCQPEDVNIVIAEVKKQDWATAGELWSDRKTG